MPSMSSCHQVGTKNVGDTHSWSSQQCCRDYAVNAFLSPGGYKEQRGHLLLVQSAVLQGLCRQCLPITRWVQRTKGTPTFGPVSSAAGTAINVFLSPGGYKERRGHPLLVQSAVLQGLCHQCFPIARWIQRT